jgi:hypothetical protein
MTEEDFVIEPLTGLCYRAGWVGVFTTKTAPGALINGTRVIKVAQDPEGDRTPPGTAGRVLGSIGHPDLVGIMYFIEWDNAPKFAVGCHQRKLRAI